MGLRIYNSLSNQIEEFEPIHKGKVNMYVCGPTVYNHIHIGNARPVVFYDMVRNYLKYLGYEVCFASNITDIDDKIINQAIKEKKPEKEIAEFYEKSYFESVKTLGSQKPDFIPHATEYIDEMISFIEELIEKDYAYVVEGDVFFRVNKIPNYGCLSNQISDELEQGARISVNTKKENPLDFTLWKKTDVGIKWKSPFGEGRPGWHTECVGRLELEGQKMSKSKGNVIYVKDLENTITGMILRMVLLFTPYRNNFSYTNELFEQYEKIFVKWQRAYKQGLYELQLIGIKVNLPNPQLMHEFEEYMNQDFNVQNVMMLIEKITKDLNVSIRSKNCDAIAVNLSTMQKILEVLGINLFVHPMSKEQLEVYRKWNQARNDKDFAAADGYRIQLTEWGIL